MTTKAGGAYIEIRGSDKQLQGDLDKSHNKVASAAKKMESSVTKAFKRMAVVAAAAFAVVAYKTVSLVKESALLAARFETLDIVMKQVGKNAGYTAEEMDKYDEGLRKTGISMIESRNSLARMAQAQLDLSQATILGRIAQDAAVIGNINSSEAFQRMIYGIQSGRTLILRTIGINVNFANSYKEIAEATNRTVASFSEAEKAIIRQNVVIEYGSRIAGTYEAAMTTAGKKLSSFTRYVEDFKVKMGLAFGPATVMLVDAATKAMKEFQVEISKPEAQKALRDLSSQLAITIIQLGQDLPKAIKSTTDAIAEIQAIYNSLPEGVIGAAGVGLIGRMLFGAWGPAKIVAGLYLINKGMSSVGMGLGDIAKGYKEAADNFQKAWEEITGERVKGVAFFTINDENRLINQFERMEKIILERKSRLDQALADPDKYYGEIVFPLARTEEYYKQLEALAIEKREFELELENEGIRMFEENLAYRLELKQQYYKDIEAAAQEARDIEEEMEDQKRRMAEETAAYQKELNAQRFSDIQASISMMTQGFQTISEMGGKHSKEAFAMYKGFKIIETTIATYSAAIKAYESLVGIPLIGPFIAPAAAAAAVAFGMAQVAMIKSAQPPSYDQGGISNAEGVYRTGPIREAHIPIPSGGKIPVKVDSKEKQTVNVIMNNPTFQDLETQRQVMAQIAGTVAAQVAPGAIVENYQNDGEIRQMVRGGI